MESDAIAVAGQQALWVSLVVGGPALVLLLIIGLVVSVLQALTQVQEASLAFVPKMLGLGILLLVGGSSATGVMRGFAQQVFDAVVAIGGAH